MAEDGLGLLILLLPPLECWDYRLCNNVQFYTVLGMEPLASRHARQGPY